MRITELRIKEYKNLKDFDWKLNRDSPIAAIIGKNASGKTNLLTALIEIFCQCFVYCKGKKTKSNFEFSIIYETYFQGADTIITFEWKDSKYAFFQNQDTTQAIRDRKALPEKVFTYYAGDTQVFFDIINKYVAWDLFSYASLQDNQFILLSMFGSRLPNIKDNLKILFQITELKEFTLTIQNPWKKITSVEKPTFENFWNAEPYLANFYHKLQAVSISQKKDTTFRNSKLILRIDRNGLEKIMENRYEYDLYRLLQSSVGSGFIRKIDNFAFIKEGVSNPIGFEDLSEGERQRISLLGAFAIYQGKETLFLLDEPDAFAHPRWQWNFIPDILKEIQGNRDNVTQQVIFATHSPIVLSSLSEPAFMMKDGTITQMNSTFGNTIDETLAEQEVPYREADVSDKLKRYIGLIQGGYAQTTEALELRTLLAEKLGANHSELKDADILISLYE